MPTRRRIIIDSDPGVDDILAFLLALTADPEDLEILLFSLTYGNIEVDHCLRNIITLFAVLSKEVQYRKSSGRPHSFKSLLKNKPIIAVGADGPLHEEELALDYFFGKDGLANVHTTHPHFTPEEHWNDLFKEIKSHPKDALSQAMQKACFTPSTVPAHKEMLRILRENPDQSITIVAVGPLTNLAMAIEEDPETFLRAKEVVVMGGAISVPGNVTPLAEFNTHSDTFAAAKVLALTSKKPELTWPPVPAGYNQHLPEFLKKGIERPLQLTLFPLDVTQQHAMVQDIFDSQLRPFLASSSPLAEWINAFMQSLFVKIGSLEMDTDEAQPDYALGKVSINLHDPLTIWYLMNNGEPPSPKDEQGNSIGKEGWKFVEDVDVRVETVGQWTKGMCVVDKRKVVKKNELEPSMRGNCVRVCTHSGWEESFGEVLVDRIFH